MAARFSIVVTCHNQRDFIPAAVRSALSQNPRLCREVIVVDDGSSDGSLEVLRQFGDSIQLCRLTPNRGAVEARNEGARRAQGEYLVFLDGDDLLLAWALDIYEELIAAQHPIVLIGNVVSFRGTIPAVIYEPNPIRFVRYPAMIRKDRPVGMYASSYAVQRQAFWEAGGWTPGIFELDLQDLSLKLGLAPLALIDSPATALYRIHAANSIHTVPPFVRNLERLLDKEQAGQYPGGRAYRGARRGWLGGLLVFWIRRSVKAGRYRDAARLLSRGWSMVAMAIIRRVAARLSGRRPWQTLPAPAQHR